MWSGLKKLKQVLYEAHAGRNVGDIPIIEPPELELRALYAHFFEGDPIPVFYIDNNFQDTVNHLTEVISTNKLESIDDLIHYQKIRMDDAEAWLNSWNEE